MTKTDDEELVGPILRQGDLAEAVIDAIEEDNPDQQVTIVDRDDYVRIHTMHECVLRQETLSKHMGEPYELSRLEIDMPSFTGRMETRHDRYRWYLTN